MGLYNKFVNQTRKPEGFLGGVMINGMNSGHAKMADWGLSFFKDYEPDRVVDLGCGGGRNINAILARFPNATGTAVDYSELSVQKTKEYNSVNISEGRLEVKQGDVSKLTLPDDEYDFASAFETVYFWPGLEKCFREVARILRPGGSFLIVNESDGTDDTSLKYEKIIDGMKCYTAEQLSDALRKAGFAEINTWHHENKSWIAVLARLDA